jgi:nitrite reductase (NADH) large subunit
VRGASGTLTLPGVGRLGIPAHLARLRGVLARRRASATTRFSRRRLIVVGDGMVGHRFCERLVELGAQDRFEIVVLGEEATPAYDRVHLTDVLRGRPKQELLLRDAGWYERSGIRLRLSERVERIDRAAKSVVTAGGETVAYDVLVLATGSRAVIPRFAGADAEVMPYRTLVDAERILSELDAPRRAGAPIAVIGGGLLGLEAARAFQELGCRVLVIEAASQLLPRQLDPDAAEELASVLSAAGLELCLRARVERLSRTPAGVRVELAGEAPIDVGAVVAAVGARARDELGQLAGLRCTARGGIAVDDDLRSSDPSIYAIGECASHAGVPHGLVAPGYAMADALARSLTGKRRRLGPQQAVTRLKLDLTEVNVLGNPIESASDQELVYRAAGVYRRLLVSRARVVAAVCVGPWDELAGLQRAVEQGHRIARRTLSRFAETGTLGVGRTSLPIASWPDAAVVCQCANVTCGVLRAKLSGGQATPDALGRATSAGTLCGGCKPLLGELCGSSARTPAPTRLWIPALCALALALITAFSPRIALPHALRDWTLHHAWIDPFYKQTSGFGLLGTIAVGLVLSLRKRVPRFRVGSYAVWRWIHAALGALGLGVLFAHTGFRLGYNLNLVLALAFLTGASTGAAAGLLPAPGGPGTAGERRAMIATLCRRLHDCVFWLLLPLIAFHVVKTYYY